MRIVWDESKRLTNLAKHGLDFADLDPDLFADAVFIRSRQGRLVAVGMFKGVVIAAVVFRRLGSEAISVISMRPANRKDKETAMTGKLSPERRALREAIKALPPLTDEEEARIQAGIALDPDNPELTEEEMATAKPFREVFPDLYESIKRSRGRPKVANPREPVTLRLSAETIARYKALGGEDWRATMVATLEKSAG